MIKKTILFFFLILVACDSPTEFSSQALQEKFINYTQEEVTFQSVLTKYKGQKILIDVWASWCKDCIVGFKDLKTIQQKNPEVRYVFLSMDKSVQVWKKAMIRFPIKGDHYYLKEGTDGSFANFINLWWIPRYMVVNETGEITVFKATEITDKKIAKALKK